MDLQQLVVDSYFDGRKLRGQGPYAITLRQGVIDSIRQGDGCASDIPTRRGAFLMPGMVEAHCHLFLDGGELDIVRRASYLKAPREEMLAVGRRSLAQSAAAGISLVRDAGDIHGVNLQLRGEAGSTAWPCPAIVCAGRAIRNAGRYGSFMAQEATDASSLEAMVAELAVDADQIKVLMTGIIDFEAGEVKGPPQFTLDQARRIAQAAKALGRRTFAHCSGAAGIDIALAAGLDSIEHGFFVTREQLRIMADQGISWVPTFAPVHFQRSRPELAGWSTRAVANLERILDGHRQQLEYAYRIGVPVLVGSDAGSHGVRHGHSYVEELMLMAGAGVGLEKLLHSATALPRSLWRRATADIAVGSRADLVLYDKSPFDALSALRDVAAVYTGGRFDRFEKAAA